MNYRSPKNDSEELIYLREEFLDNNYENAKYVYCPDKFSYGFEEKVQRKSYVSESGNLIIRKANNLDLYFAISVEDNDGDMKELSQVKATTPGKSGKSDVVRTTPSTNPKTPRSLEKNTNSNQKGVNSQIIKPSAAQPQNQQSQNSQNYNRPARRPTNGNQANISGGISGNTSQLMSGTTGNARFASVTANNKGTSKTNQKNALRKTTVDHKKVVLQAIDAPKQSSSGKRSGNTVPANFRITSNKFNPKASRILEKTVQ